jgi:hypothetical protein
MAPNAHSDFSASSAYRGLRCPGSFAAGKQFNTGRKSTIYSAEGTLAHAISESALSAGTEPHAQIGNTLAADGFKFTVDQEMADYISVYVNLLRGLRAMGYHILLETRVSPQWLWSHTNLTPLSIDLFGTADCIAYNPQTRRLLIVDLKYGRGVAVEVSGNAQLLYYANGALNPDVLEQICLLYGLNYNTTNQPKEVELVVCQPRAPHPDGPVRSVVYTTQEVLDWNLNVLYPGVEKALSDNGQTLVPGDHCRFCPASAACPALRTFALDTAKLAFRAAPIENIPADDPSAAILPAWDLTNDKLGALLDRIAVVGPWMEGLKTLAAERLNAAQTIPGWKMVPKAARRKWNDDEQVTLQNLKVAGFRDDQITTASLLSPAQVEKKVGKAIYAQLAQPFVSKQSSGLALAPEGDPRARLKGRTAQEAFNLAAPDTQE